MSHWKVEDYFLRGRFRYTQPPARCLNELVTPCLDYAAHFHHIHWVSAGYEGPLLLCFGQILHLVQGGFHATQDEVAHPPTTATGESLAENTGLLHPLAVRRELLDGGNSGAARRDASVQGFNLGIAVSAVFGYKKVHISYDVGAVLS